MTCELSGSCVELPHCEHWYDGLACCRCNDPEIRQTGAMYFDPPRGVEFRRFKRTAHLYTDGTTEQLDAFALGIGLQLKWRQHTGTSREHYDLFDGKIAAAHGAGAIASQNRHIVRVARAKRRRGIKA